MSEHVFSTDEDADIPREDLDQSYGSCMNKRPADEQKKRLLMIRRDTTKLPIE